MVTTGDRHGYRPGNTLSWRFLLLSLAVHGLLAGWPRGSETAPMPMISAAPLQVSLQTVATWPTAAKQLPQMPEQTAPVTPPEERPATESGRREAPMAQPRLAVRTAAPPEPETARVSREGPTSRSDGHPSGRSRDVDEQAIRERQVNHLQAELARLIARHFRYPRLARRHGWEGLVGLSLLVRLDGQLDAIAVTRSSGHRVLDDSARATLERIGRVDLAALQPTRTLATEIEVHYRLTD